MSSIYPREAGKCPVCGSRMLKYGNSELLDESYCYDWECEACHSTGRECYDLVFSEHIVTERGKRALEQKYIDVLEKFDWQVSSYTDDGRVELETYSPAGEDFLMCVEVEDFPRAVAEYAADFDPDEHIAATTSPTTGITTTAISTASGCRAPGTAPSRTTSISSIRRRKSSAS